MDRDELGTFLRTTRSRISPADVGLPAGLRRRVPGLRREEVAQLSGISVDYLVRLEQGRGPHPSESVLSALARTLRLTDDERDHLFRLAGTAPPEPGTIDGRVRASTLRVLDRLTDLPALVLDAKSDVLAWNAMAVALLGDLSSWSPWERNVVWRRFMTDDTRVASDPADDERTAVESVASLRAVSARYPDDPGLQRLLAALREGSPRFVRLWDEARPAARRSSTKSVDHPAVGLIELDCDSLLLPDSDQRLIVYSAGAGTPAADALALLRIVALQEMHTDH